MPGASGFGGLIIVPEIVVFGYLVLSVKSLRSGLEVLCSIFVVLDRVIVVK